MIEQPEVGYCLGIMIFRHSARGIFLLADRVYFAILAVNELQESALGRCDAFGYQDNVCMGMGIKREA